ncbi:MAG: RnfABCDGE type electron transport complex subunit D [Eubacterium ventriosum]
MVLQIRYFWHSIFVVAVWFLVLSLWRQITLHHQLQEGTICVWYLFGVLTSDIQNLWCQCEGVSFAIIFCNLLVPLIEKYTIPKLLV